MHNPPPDPPRRSWNLFERLDYLVVVAQWAVQEGLNARHSLEALMASNAELQAALDKNTEASAAAGAAITAEIAQLQAAIAAIPVGDPVTQAQLDQLTASTTALEQATAALVADDPAADPTP